ncbi:MAG: PilZ domain-containing protein [Phycisphaerae bacterium]
MYRTQPSIQSEPDQGDLATLKSWLAGARESGEEDRYAGKRSTPRIVWNESVIVEVVGKRTDGPRIYGFTRDVSAGGIGLRCRERLEPGKPVRITLEATGETLCGRIRYCSEVLGAFLVGVEFELRTDQQATLRRTA